MTYLRVSFRGDAFQPALRIPYRKIKGELYQQPEDISQYTAQEGATYFCACFTYPDSPDADFPFNREFRGLAKHPYGLLWRDCAISINESQPLEVAVAGSVPASIDSTSFPCILSEICCVFEAGELWLQS